MSTERIVGVRTAGMMVLVVLLSGAAVPTAFVGTATADPLGDMASSGMETDPYVITNGTQLQAMNDDLSAHYVLGNDIDPVQYPSSDPLTVRATDSDGPSASKIGTVGLNLLDNPGCDFQGSDSRP